MAKQAELYRVKNTKKKMKKKVMIDGVFNLISFTLCNITILSGGHFELFLKKKLSPQSQVLLCRTHQMF
jgi:hypothetical protein